MTAFDMNLLLTDVTALLQADSVLSRLVHKFESGQPEISFTLDKLNGALVSIVDLGIKRESDLWRIASVGIVVSTRRPSINDSDILNSDIGDAIQRILMANPTPGQFVAGVLGGLRDMELSALYPLEDSPEVRIREITVTYKVFR